MVSDINLNNLTRTIDDIVSKQELALKLKEKRQLRIKYGVDVTAPSLHIGHAVNLWMMRAFQECGHKVVFLIGDFTTQIGDPTGKSHLRKQIPLEEIQKNAAEFIHQVGKVLLTSSHVFELRRNSEWYNQMPLSKFLSLSSLITHAKLLQRDMFQKRMQQNKEIFIQEMLYPILQGYDSVMVESDLTIVGSDQLFNEHMGRFYQEKHNQQPQVIVTSRITPGIDGREKQSKSIGNYIALDDPPREQFGKIMSIPDNLIIPYLEVYTTLPLHTVILMKKSLEDKTINPMELKKTLASELVMRYYGQERAQYELQWFQDTFSKRRVPEDGAMAITIKRNEKLLDVLYRNLPDQSKGSIIRLIKGGGVRINNQKISENSLSTWEASIGDTIKVGKRRWFNIISLE